MGEGILIYGTAKARKGIPTLRPQSFASAVRHYYKRKMSALLGVKVKKRLNDGREITVRFTSYGNKHLFSDTYGRSKTLQRGDLLELPDILRRSTHVRSAPSSKKRTDNISQFHYFKVKLHGNDVYLNVAETVSKRKGKKTRNRFVYSVTDKIK